MNIQPSVNQIQKSSHLHLQHISLSLTYLIIPFWNHFTVTFLLLKFYCAFLRIQLHASKWVQKEQRKQKNKTSRDESLSSL